MDAAKRYPNQRSAIMPALFLAQKEHGHLSGDLLREVAGILDVPEIWVYEVSTFYGMFHTEPVGKFHIKICTNLSCQLLEAESLLAHLESRLAIEAGGNTPRRHVHPLERGMPGRLRGRAHDAGERRLLPHEPDHGWDRRNPGRVAEGGG